MWRKQEEEEERVDDYFDEDSKTKTKTCLQYEEQSLLSWEEEAFAEDAGRLGVGAACVWPPTSYSCSFCRREFRSAQALGGHMNVHRRDRARLNQSPINNNPNFTTTTTTTTNSSSFPPFQSPLPNNYHLPNPNPLSGATSSCGGRSDFKVDQLRISPSCSRVRVDNHHVGIGVLDEGLNFGFGRSRPMLGLFYDDAGAVASCKRRKTNDETSSSIQFYMKSSSLVENHHQHHIQSEVIGLNSTSLHELDLELRLGGLSKG